MSKGEGRGAAQAGQAASATGGTPGRIQSLLSRPNPVFVFQREAGNGSLRCVALNEAAALLTDADAAANDGGISPSSPAADPQISALLRSSESSMSARRRNVVWRSLASGEERLMRLTAEFLLPDLLVLGAEDLGDAGESRRKLAVMHAFAELSAYGLSRSAFLTQALHLVRSWLGSDAVSFCEMPGALPSDAVPAPEDVAVLGDGAVLGVLRIQASGQGMVDPGAREFLETLGLLMGETLQKIDRETVQSDSEEYFHLLAASTDSAVVIYDAEGRIQRWNRAAQKMYGYLAAEVIGRSCSILYSEEDVARGKPDDDLRMAREKGSFQEEEAVRRRRDGELFVVSAKTTALVDESGRLRGFARTLRDITARKKSETELHQNLAALDKRVRELRCLYEVAALISDQALPLAAVMRGVADLVARAYQYPDITLVRIRVGDDIYQTKGFEETAWEQTSTIGTLSSHLGTLQVCYSEERPEADEGPFSEEERDLLESIGQLLGDFLERRMTAEALRRSNALLETLFSSTNYKIAFLDNDFRYIRVNDAYAKSWGHTAGDFVGRSHFGFFPGDEQIFREVLRTDTPYTAADKLREVVEADGVASPTYWDWELFPMSGEGMTGLVLILVDRTRRHRARRELEDSREELRKLASHLQELREEERKIVAREIHDELGGLLTALKMEISLLGKGDSPLKGACLDSYDSALDLVDQSISMVQRITSNLRPRILDDFGLVPAMEWHLKDYQKRAGITCTLKTGGSIPMEKNRAAAIFRIFQETLTNVARHAQATKVAISLRKTGGRLHMRVADNGVGIDESQVVAASSYGIMGIRERAQAMGGQVSIRGVRGRGTTLELDIPLPDEEGE
ncbi:MAG: PAS domain-containing sensor histidine kinase [Spirochaetia bacterium]